MVVANDNGSLFQELTPDELLVVQSLFLMSCEKVEGCLEWQGMTANHYGLIFRKVHGQGKVRVRAHRISYLLFKGPIPDGLQVCHRCDNPICCLPDHLFLGTMKDNIQDAMTKGRMKSLPPRPGSSNNNAKLTEEQVVEMRSLYPSLSIPVLARRYAVSRSTVHRIITRQVWTHV